MTRANCDIAIIGGGLAGGLIALALRRARPDLAVRLIEAGETPGGNHRWSWFASDLGREASDLLSCFPAASWDNGYDVAFPGYTRHLATPYRSLSSHDFAAVLGRELAPGTLLTGRRANGISAEGIVFDSSEAIAAATVIDCRGFAPSANLSGGWQVFSGRSVRTHRPHGVTRPTIMDARVAQAGGYRFVYVLPLGADEIFVEDTYYQDSPSLDPGVLDARISAYCADRGWTGETTSAETGVLPVITGGDLAPWQAERRVPGVVRAGAHAGFAHPLTSYTLPFAADTAIAIARSADLPGPALADEIERRARDHWARTRFYRMLGAMLFAAEPGERRRVFERFYRLDEALIERFYAARSTRADRLRVLCGRPPVPLTRAFAALAGRQPPLKEPA